MDFSKPEVIIEESPTKRRVLRFYLLRSKLVLDVDVVQERKTKRHKWRNIAKWSRLDRRDNDFDKREVPPEAIEQALADIRGQITYSDKDSI